MAVAGVLAQAPRPAILLYETRRFAVRPVPGLRQWKLSVNTLRLLRLLSLFQPFGTVYVPHHKISRRFAPLLAGAQHVEYLDDGLDTLRLQPRNFDLSRLRAGDRYHTFSEHGALPPWLDRLDVRRDCALAAVLGTSLQPRQDLAAWDHVFIESPGLNPQALCAALALDPARVLVIRHPVAFKRGPLPEGCAAVVGNTLDSEGSLLATRGKTIYCGETMAFFLLLHAGAAQRHTLWLQMGEAQWQGLSGLPPMRFVTLPGVAGRVGVLDADAAAPGQPA